MAYSLLGTLQSSVNDAYAYLTSTSCTPWISCATGSTMSYGSCGLPNLKKGKKMFKVSKLLETKETKLVKKYLLDEDGQLDVYSEVMQKVLFNAFKKELLAECQAMLDKELREKKVDEVTEEDVLNEDEEDY